MQPHVDVAGLLDPIAGDAPAGLDPRADISPASHYFRLRDARADARAAERQTDSDSTRPSGAENWQLVREHSLSILGTVGKDIEVAAWLTEALVRLDGIDGLAGGVWLMAGLVERYWDGGLHPLPDEDGIEGRVSPLAGLNGIGSDGTLMQPLRKLVLFNRADGVPVTVWRFEQAEEVEGIGDAARKKQRLAAGALPFRTLEEEARSFGAGQLGAVGRGARRALKGWQALAGLLDRLAGSASPPTSRVAGVLEKVLRVAERYAPAQSAEAAEETGAAAEPEAAVPAADGDDAAPDVAPGAARPQPAAPLPPSRDDMLASLARIAEFFRVHEPHSPLSYTLDEAVRRGRMSWPELLGEVVPDPQARAVILSQLGIRPEPG